MDKSKFRLQFDITKEALSELDKLKVEAGASTRAEVVRNALRLYSWFITQRSEGNKILVKSADETKQLEHIFL